MKQLTDRLTAWSSRSAPCLLLTTADPYLAFLLRISHPDMRVEESTEPTNGEVAGADAVLVDLQDPGLGRLMQTLKPTKVIGLVDASVAAVTAVPPGVDLVLQRPYDVAELSAAVHRLTGAPKVSAPLNPRMRRAMSVVRYARVAAVGLALLVEIAAPSLSVARGAIVAAALLYAVACLLNTRIQASTAWIDVVVASAVLGLTGAASSSFMAFGLVAALHAGLVLGMRTGAVAALVITAGSAPAALVSARGSMMGDSELIAWFCLFPLLAITSGLAARIWQQGQHSSRGLLEEANRVLSMLNGIARSIPGGLSLRGVAAGTLQEIRDVMESPAGMLLVGSADIFVGAGSFGSARDGDIVVPRSAPELDALVRGGTAQAIQAAELPGGLRAALEPHACWIAAPLRHHGVVLGMLLAACADHNRHDHQTVALDQLAQETAVAVENARLFDRVRQLSVDDERRRLARELHDGVAQTLTHVRMELEFLARHGADDPAQMRQEAERLSRVVARTVSEVRSTITGLREGLDTEGLANALQLYINDLRGLGGPELVFISRGSSRWSPQEEMEAFRVAQEAVSNALRHSEATRIEVSLDVDDTVLRLRVEDDGVGIAGTAESAGLGLKAMRERARALEATLDVQRRQGGGTRVELVLGKSHSSKEVASA